MKEKLQNLAIKLQKFMYGRNGIDELYRVLLVLYLIIIIPDMFINNRIANTIFLVLSLLVLFYMFFRVFSKNIVKRRKENQIWLNFKNKILKSINYAKDKWKFRKTHIFRTCPNCKRHLKLPKKKGTHNVKCPCCSTNFKVKVL